MRISRTERIMFLLIGIISLLMIGNIGLFLRMNQLQTRIVNLIEPFERPQGLDVGSKAPTFSLADENGKEFSLSDYLGTNLMLAFFSTNCPQCQSMYPVVAEFVDENNEITFLMISRGSPDVHRQIVRKYEYNFPILNGNDDVFEKYMVPGTPWFYFLDYEGMVVHQGTGNSLEDLERLIGGEASS